MRAALILLLIGGATAQQLPITGEVASRATGEPVAGATLRVSSYNQATTVADAAGHFDILVPTTKQFLIVDRPGYLSASVSVEPKPGDSSIHLSLRLTPQAVITGRVVDENGWPVERAVISAEAQRLTPTGTKWQTLRSAETDDRGEYRLTKLATGTYVLRVRPSPTLQSWDARYLGFYYPSADMRRDAEAVAAREGQETRANFVMKPREGFEIHGRATVPDTCRQLGRTQVRLENPDAFLSWMVGAEVADDGTFAIRHVPAGEYILHAELGRDTNEMRPPICSAGRHIEVSQNLDVALSLNVPKLQDWSGTIEGSAINPERTHIFVQRAGSNSRPQALIRPDGTFTIPGVWEGSYSITASGEGRPVSIEVGGRRVFDQPVEIEGDAAPIRIRVMDTKSVGRLAGTVKGAAGAPQLGAAVLLLPQGEGVITGMIANQNGAFSGIVAPGNYRVYAIEQASVARMYDPEFLKTRERDSRTIVVAPGENAALEFVVR